MGKRLTASSCPSFVAGIGGRSCPVMKETDDMITYSNPRTAAVVLDWPSGKHRVEARFFIESHPSRGERGVRVTTGKPKTLTYARKARIVDGDDGKTYIAELTSYDHVSIMQGNMQFQQECIFPRDGRYPAVLALFD